MGQISKSISYTMSNSENTIDNSYLNMDMLRFTTAGSVDDGKSTLIGRLLYDSKSIFEDQMEAIEKTSKSSGEEEVNLALLTDGLKAEREQKSLLMLLTVTSPPQKENLSLRILRVILSTPETWLQVLQLQIWLLS